MRTGHLAITHVGGTHGPATYRQESHRHRRQPRHRPGDRPPACPRGLRRRHLRTVQAAAPYLKQAGWGRVINISGGAGCAPGTAVSGGIRNIGTVNLTKSMANALGPYGINVNAIYPGQTITEAMLERYAEQAQRDGTTVEEIHKAADARTVLKHVVT